MTLDLQTLAVPVGVGVGIFVATALLLTRVTAKQTVRSRLNNVINRTAPTPVALEKGPPGQAGAKAKRAELPAKAAGAVEAEIRKRLAQKRVGNKRTLKHKMAEAGVVLTPTAWTILSVATGVVVFALLLALGLPLPVVLIGGALGGFWLPGVVLGMIAARRRQEFLKELADALEATVRGLQAGIPVSEAMAMIARDFEGPVGEELSVVVDEQRLGTPLPEALGNLAQRMPLPEVNMLAMAVSIQLQTGGSLSEALTNLANVIRGRERLKRKIASMSSEAKASAMIMGALPVFVVGALSALNPDYIGLLFSHPTGKFLIGFCVFWMGLGVLVMVRMVNFKY